MQVTIDQPIAIIIAAGIAVVGQVVIAMINKRVSQTATTKSPRRKRKISRKALISAGVSLSICAPILGLVLLGTSGAPITRSFVVLSVAMAALLVISVALLIAVFIITSTVRRDVAVVGDLVIRSARYGSGDIDIDATDAVRAKMKDGRLNVPVCNALVGTDPCKGITKALKVEYTYGGKEQSITVNEEDMLTLPIA